MIHLRGTLLTRGQNLNTVLTSGRRDRSLSQRVKFFQTLRPNYSDQMSQFVFDVAGHRDGIGDLLSQ